MMKLSFSTVGCPRWSFQEIIATAKDFGYQGVEIRGLGSELFAPRTRPFAPENLPATLKTLRETQLEVPVCLISAPATCREEKLSFSLEASAPMTCMMSSQQAIAQWSESHPQWQIGRWKCVAADRLMPDI